jgi:predicted ester cyclase
MGENKKILEMFFNEVCNQHRWEMIDEIFSQGVVFNGKCGSTKDVVNYLTEIQYAFKDPKVEINKIIAEEDRVSTMRTWTGVQVHDYYNNPLTNKLMSWTEISVVKLKDGKIVDDWVVHGELSVVE